MRLRSENAAKHYQKCCYIAKISILVHEIAPMRKMVVSDLGPEVEIPPFLRMRNERHDQLDGCIV